MLLLSFWSHQTSLCTDDYNQEQRNVKAVKIAAQAFKCSILVLAALRINHNSVYETRYTHSFQ